MVQIKVIAHFRASVDSLLPCARQGTRAIFLFQLLWGLLLNEASAKGVFQFNQI